MNAVTCAIQVLWNHHNPFCAFVGSDAGILTCVDVRNTVPLYKYLAHSSALTSLVLSTSVDGCLVTASNDQTVKVWDVNEAPSGVDPKLVIERRCKIGAIHSAGGSPDEQLVVCVGGEREMKIINVQNDRRFVEHFVDGGETAHSTNTEYEPIASSSLTGEAKAVAHKSLRTATKSEKNRKKKKSLKSKKL